ncbi:hypothetical protein GCM10010340_22130 [Streptomyces griseoloalbus]|nr:hypothetical protein GCM10010294_47940 [Streptomyces griseoloalbus]GGW43552.1 hypothetical protein GCM10010340_22130 [Streptomyces albaduncus]
MTATHTQAVTTTIRAQVWASDGARATAAPPAAALVTSTASDGAGEVRGALADGCWRGGAGTDMVRSLGP